jgi:hypothetical protein
VTTIRKAVHLVLQPNSAVRIRFEGSDGEIDIGFDDKAIKVHTNWADSTGRKGVIYEERFGEMPAGSFGGDLDEYSPGARTLAGEIHRRAEEARGERRLADIDQALRFQAQEFHAVDALYKAYARLPPLVDNGYPEARRLYESALSHLIAALRRTKRIP